MIAPAISAFANGETILFGVWEGKSLQEVFTANTEDQIKITSKIEGFNPREINLVHDSNFFEHVDFDSFEPQNLKQYFTGGDAIKLADTSASYEKLKQQNIGWSPSLVDISQLVVLACATSTLAQFVSCRQSAVF